MYYKGEKYESTISNPGDFHGFGDVIRRELTGRIHSRDGLKILDVGTGFGSNVEFLSRITGKTSGKIWTLDPSDEVLKNVERSLRGKGLDRNVTFVKGNVEKLPFEDHFFDVVISVMVLHHLQGLESGIREMLRVLKKDEGKLILADWNPEANVLPFSSRHKKEDFFEPESVAGMIRDNGATSKVEEFEYWYIVEAIL